MTIYFYLRHHPWIAYGASAVIAVAIITLSLTPLTKLPEAPGGDKLHHLIAYAALALPTAFVKSRHLLWLTLCYIALGAGIEVVQPYVNRYGEWLDLMANILGVLFGTIGGIAFATLSEAFAARDGGK